MERRRHSAIANTVSRPEREHPPPHGGPGPAALHPDKRRGRATLPWECRRTAPASGPARRDGAARFMRASARALLARSRGAGLAPAPKHRVSPELRAVLLAPTVSTCGSDEAGTAPLSRTAGAQSRFQRRLAEPRGIVDIVGPWIALAPERPFGVIARRGRSDIQVTDVTAADPPRARTGRAAPLTDD